MKYKLHLGEKVYDVPHRLTLNQFSQLSKWDITLEQNWRKVMSIVMRVPYEDTLIIPDKTIELAIAFLIDKIYPEDAPLNKEGFIDISNVKVGTFIDMEVYISKGVQANIKDIVKTLYNIEPTGDELLYDYYGGIKYYLNWRINIFNSYRKLFGLDDEFSKNEQELQEKIDPAYNWYAFIITLADEDFMKLDLVTEKPIIQALNFLAYKKDKAEEERKKLNELYRTNRLN
jgi:hypothetical protein